jgi:hypothetical protein
MFQILFALICYNTDCLPPVAKIDPPPPRVACPKEFRAKNYAKSNGGADTWEVFCAESGSFVYGGLSFYDGEGISGTGGLLRLKRDTNQIELRRLPMLRDVSVNSIAADGDIVWFGTTQNGECTGQPFVHGLVRYDWKSGDIKTYEGTDDGPIGFVVDAIAIRDGVLWVQTDLGLSKFDGQWHHFDAKRREQPAKEILEPLLRTVPRECLRTETFDNELVDGLAKFRPRFLNAYLRSVPVREWQCPELRFMSARIKDFAALRQRVLSVDPPGSRFFPCAVEGFSVVKHGEREWRDLLVAEWRKHPDSFTPSAFRFYRGDEEIGRMLIASRYRAIVVGAQILGERGIPLLRERLGHVTMTEAAAIVYGLQVATHQRLSPEGKVETIADPGSFRDFLEKRWWMWNDAQRNAVIAAWSKFILPAHER